MSFEQPSLKGRALRLLSTREHSRVELQRKLQRYEEEPGSLQVALEELQAKGFISEPRVLESVVNRRASKLGVARIQQELFTKGLDASLVAAAVSDLRGTELARAREVWRKKFGQPPSDASERAKQVRFLAGRGFAGDAIRRVVSGADELMDD
jgi:regulatory protein